MEKHMRYQVRVAGRIFEGSDVNVLLKCAVQARKEMLKNSGEGINAAPAAAVPLGPRLVHTRGEISAA